MPKKNNRFRRYRFTQPSYPLLSLRDKEGLTYSSTSQRSAALGDADEMCNGRCAILTSFAQKTRRLPIKREPGTSTESCSCPHFHSCVLIVVSLFHFQVMAAKRRKIRKRKLTKPSTGFRIRHPFRPTSNFFHAIFCAFCAFSRLINFPRRDLRDFLVTCSCDFELPEGCDS